VRLPRATSLRAEVDETAPRDVIDCMLKVQNQHMKLAGMLQGAGSCNGFDK
jgi:hypothetical protein